MTSDKETNDIDCLVGNRVRLSDKWWNPQAPKIKITRKIFTPNNASFGFNLNKSINCEVYAQGNKIMIDSYFPPNSSHKAPRHQRRILKERLYSPLLIKEIKM